jgi:hypothetical protein
LLRIVGAVLALGYLLPMMPATPIRASAEAAATRDGGAPSSVPAGAGGNRPSLPQIFEMTNNPGGAGALPGSPQANLVLGYRLLNEAGNLPWDRIREKRTLLEQALGAARAAGDPTLEYRVGFFLASVLRQVKKNAAALALLQRNVALVRGANLPFNADAAIGGHYAMVAQPEKAVPIFRAGLALAKGNHYDVANAARRLGVALLMAGRFGEARRALDDSLEALARERAGEGAMNVLAPLNGVVPSNEDRLSAELLARNAELRRQLAAAGAPAELIKSATPERFGAFERSRIERWLDTSRLREWTAAFQARPEEAFALAQRGRKELLDTTWFLDDSWLDHVIDRKPPAPSEILGQARQAARRLRATIVEYSPLFSLSPNIPVLQGNPPRLAGVLTWVITPDGRFTQRQLKSEAALDALAALLRDPNATLAADVRQRRSEPPGTGPAARGFALQGSVATAPAAPLRDLYRLLIEPIEDLLPPGEEARVVFVPRDELSLVPFAALTDRRGRQMVDRFAIWIAPELGLVTGRPAGHARDARGALVVEVSSGAEVFFLRDASRHPLPSLPGAKAEATEVAQKLEARVLSSKEATKAEVMRRMTNAAVIHFAAHGLADERSGLLSAIALAPGKVEDGLLSAREVMAMQLSADLVVLSACDTGRGHVAGDALYGLPRAFLSAGASTVLSSLWKAADQPTRFLIDAFYREVLEGTDKARALRRAMVATRHKYPAPAHWAGFILTGEPDFSDSTASWKGSAPAAPTVQWRRALVPVPVDAHLIADNDEQTAFTTARNPDSVMAYYRATLGAAGYEERQGDGARTGASFDLVFERGKSGTGLHVMGLSTSGSANGPADAADPQMMVQLSRSRVFSAPKRDDRPGPPRR